MSKNQSRAMLARMAATHARRPVLMELGAVQSMAEQLRLAIHAEPQEQRPRGLAALARWLKADAFKAEMSDYDDDDSEGVSAPNREARFGQALQPRVAGLSASRIQGEGFGYVIADGVAIISLSGAIPEEGGMYCGAAWHGYDTILQSVSEASKDARVKAILFLQSSPGGVVAGGLSVAARAIANAGKPVWVHAAMSCSAAYWLASGASRILAGPYSQIGSIGAVVVHEDFSGALDRAGVKITAITFGSSKVDGNPWEGLSAQAVADLQSDIDQIGADFVSAVVAGRPALAAEAVIGTQARVFMGSHNDPARSALGLGLIDGLTDTPLEALDQLVAQLASPASLVLPTSQPAAGAASVVHDPANPQTQEASMAKKTMKARIAAVQASDASADDKLSRIQAIMDETDEEEEIEAEGDDAAPANDGEDDEEEAAPEASAMATAKAIIALPEAKGREALANHLAFEAGMTVAKAKATLVLAPKASALNPLNPNIGVGDAPSKQAAPVQAVGHYQSAMAKLGHKPRT